MGLLTSYGTQWGVLPMTAGRIHWVAPSDSYTVDGRSYSASDNNDGLSPERALRRVTQAQSNAVANAGEIIAMLPGTHTVTSSIAASKAGITYLGLPYMPWGVGASGAVSPVYPQVTLTTSAADECMNITAADITLANIRMLPVTQQKWGDFTVAADRLRVINCMIDLATATAHANTRGLHAAAATSAPNLVQVQGCFIYEGNGGTSNGIALEMGASIDFLIERCLIAKKLVASSAAWSVAVQFQDNCYGVIRDNDVHAVGAAGNAITKCFNGVTHTAAEAVTALRNFKAVNVTALFDDWAAGDLSIGNNYTATVAGGTGGTLITATT